ncbi:MAG TPA: IDEAL domain-containing protein [Bacillales bacterium]|nr:IDEAL domain-containing protein [Bacillales bacterium]
MSKRMSYNENMKNFATRKQNIAKVSIADVYSQMVLDESWFKLRKERLEEAIDEALENRNREQFMKLSGEYKLLMQTW